MPQTVGVTRQISTTHLNLTRVLVVLLVCCLIALFTWFIWRGDFISHLSISLGYGVSALLSSALIALLLPNFHRIGRSLLNLVCTLLFGSINAAYWIIGSWDWQQLPRLFPGLLLALTITGVLTFGLYFFEQKFRIQQALEVAKREHAEQQQALLLAELKQLQSQIEPHFLFNTLANINALITLEPTTAQQLLTRLTTLLRRNLHSSRQPLGKLSDEVALLDDYLAIQQIRLGERLHYHIELAPDCQTLPFVPMLLQPFVHGIEPSKRGGEVQINVQQQAQQLQIRIEDSGVGIEHASASPRQSGHGIALSNIRQRLSTLFGNEATLTLQPRLPHGTAAIINLPLSALTSLGANAHD
jgi:sensor histidine kinase YesM